MVRLLELKKHVNKVIEEKLVEHGMTQAMAKLNTNGKKHAKFLHRKDIRVWSSC